MVEHYKIIQKYQTWWDPLLGSGLVDFTIKLSRNMVGSSTYSFHWEYGHYLITCSVQVNLLLYSLLLHSFLLSCFTTAQ